MKRGPFIVLAGLLSVLLLAAAGVYAYDAQRTDKLADGLTVNGVPIGGLTPAQARAKLNHALIAPLQRPVRIMLPDGERVRLHLARPGCASTSAPPSTRPPVSAARARSSRAPGATSPAARSTGASTSR